METACGVNSVASDAKKRYLALGFLFAFSDSKFLTHVSSKSNTDLVIQSVLESQLPHCNCNEGGGLRSINNNISELGLPVITLHGL